MEVVPRPRRRLEQQRERQRRGVGEGERLRLRRRTLSTSPSAYVYKKRTIGLGRLDGGVDEGGRHDGLEDGNFARTHLRRALERLLSLGPPSMTLRGRRTCTAPGSMITLSGVIENIGMGGAFSSLPSPLSFGGGCAFRLSHEICCGFSRDSQM